MEKSILNTVDTGSENESRFAIRQLNKNWGEIVANLHELIFFVCCESGEIKPVKFHRVDMLLASDIDEFLKDPDTSLFILVAREEVEQK